jgi:hypothetical protein
MPGAVRIWTNETTDVENVAFLNRGGGTVLVMTNASDQAQTVRVHVPERGWLVLPLGPGASATVRWT